MYCFVVLRFLFKSCWGNWRNCNSALELFIVEGSPVTRDISIAFIEQELSLFHEESAPVSSNQFYKWLWTALNFFYATFVNTAECSYTFISLFTSLSLCCLHLFRAVFMEELASLEHLALVSRCFKITLSVSLLSNKNAELIRLFTMKNKTFFQFASFAVCTLLFPSCYT